MSLSKYGHISRKQWKRNIKYAITLLDDCITLSLYDSPVAIALGCVNNKPKVFGNE